MFAQNIPEGYIRIRFTEDYETHSVGYYGEGSDKPPVFDPIPPNYNRDSIKTIIKHELEKYPFEALEKSGLREILVADGIYFLPEYDPEERSNGTYLLPVPTGNVIFLDGLWQGLPKTLHHEISSVLFLKMASDDPIFRVKYEAAKNWFEGITPYFGSPSQFRRAPKQTDNKLTLRNDNYALTNFENDYNSIASSLFTPNNVQFVEEQLVKNGQKFWEFMDEAKLKEFPIYTKVMIIIHLYQYIDPKFTVDYFRSMEK